MEAELKPKVLETFDLVATNYKKLRKLQDQVVEREARPIACPGADERQRDGAAGDDDGAAEQRQRQRAL